MTRDGLFRCRTPRTGVRAESLLPPRPRAGNINAKEMSMKRYASAAGLLLLWAAVACGQTGTGWLRGEWSGTGYQSDTDTTWAMKLTAKGRSYSVEYPSLECSGSWRLLSLSRARAVFRETIT